MAKIARKTKRGTKSPADNIEVDAAAPKGAKQQASPQVKRTSLLIGCWSNLACLYCITVSYIPTLHSLSYLARGSSIESKPKVDMPGRRALILLLGDSITQLSFSAVNAGWGAHLADQYQRRADGK